MRILASFPNLKSANEAFRMLRAEGITKAYVDVDNTNNDIVNSLPGTTFRTSIYEPSSNAPTISNSTSIGENKMDGAASNNNYNYTLVIDTDEMSADNVKNIINEMGGVVKEESNSNELK